MTSNDLVVQGVIPIAVRDHGGTGPDVVLLHGATRNLLDWEPVAARLRDRFRLVALDLRGHGLSGDGPWTWDAALDDVAAVVDALGLRRPAVVGHSLGGMLAGLWARDRECSAAVNLDGHGMGTPDLYDGLPADLVGERLAEMRAMSTAATDGRGPFPLEAVDGLVAAMSAAAGAVGIGPAEAEEQLRRSLSVTDAGVVLRPAPGVARDVLAVVDDLDLLALWQATQAPLLVVNAVAADSGPAPTPWAAEMMAAYRRGLSAALAARAGGLLSVSDVDADHGLVLNRPELVAEVVTDFLSTANVT